MSAPPDPPSLLAAPTLSGEQPDVASSTEDYARRFAGPVGAWFLEVQARQTLELLAPLQRPLRILDVGGGHAQLVPHLLAAGHEVVVVGSTPACAQRLQPWLQGGRCRFTAAPLLRLPYENESFDVALSFRILSHLSSWRQFIAELCRVARYSVLVDYPALYSANLLSSALFALKVKIEGDTRTFGTFRHSEIRSAFHGAGFQPGAVRHQYFFPMALHRLMGSTAISRSLEAPMRRLWLTQLLGSPVIVRADRAAARASQPLLSSGPQAAEVA